MPEHDLEGSHEGGAGTVDAFLFTPQDPLTGVTGVSRDPRVGDQRQELRNTSEPIHGRIRRQPILGGLISEYEAAASYSLVRRCGRVLAPDTRTEASRGGRADPRARDACAPASPIPAPSLAVDVDVDGEAFAPSTRLPDRIADW
jgi:hypothetical protein